MEDTFGGPPWVGRPSVTGLTPQRPGGTSVGKGSGAGPGGPWQEQAQTCDDL